MWKKLYDIADSRIDDYSFSSDQLPNYVSNLVNGAEGSVYAAFWVDKKVKELRIDDIGYIQDYQSLYYYYATNKPDTTILSGSIKVALQ